MLMCEDLLVACAEITHGFLMNCLDVTMKIWPTETCDVTLVIWTIVTQQEQRVFEDLLFLVLDAEVLVDSEEVGWLEILEPFHGIISEDDEI